jgi:hypothetical protein
VKGFGPTLKDFRTAQAVNKGHGREERHRLTASAELQECLENIGVAPDIEVEQDPALVRQGRDPQLEKAVETVLEELQMNPPL